jgi:gamma-glutamyltranspeptidase/glutathione hydrolase
VTALQALGTADRLRRLHPTHDEDAALRVHLQVEAVRAALVDRDAHVGDPLRMHVKPAALVAPGRLDELAAGVDPARAGAWPPATPQPGGTAYLCAADREGRSISLIQSNFMGFGSGLVAPFGVVLQNRAARLRLDPSAVDAVGPSVVPLHTLVPALARRDGQVVLTLGTMGGDGQPQTHLQVLDRLRRGQDLQTALAGWRFLVQPDDGLVVVESRAPDAVVQGLRDRGHEVHRIEAWSSLLGHAHAIQRTGGGWAAASDPRSEGGVVGA